MDALPIKPERLAELEDLARRRGTSTAEALDEALAAYLEWFRGLAEVIDSLKQVPSRCPLAPENREVDFEVRQLANAWVIFDQTR
jgi:hypothetical protein